MTRNAIDDVVQTVVRDVAQTVDGLDERVNLQNGVTAEWKKAIDRMLESHSP